MRGAIVQGIAILLAEEVAPPYGGDDSYVISNHARGYLQPDAAPVRGVRQYMCTCGCEERYHSDVLPTDYQFIGQCWQDY